MDKKLKYISANNSGFFHSGNFLGNAIDVRISSGGKRALLWKGDGRPAAERPCRDESQIPLGWTLAYDLNLDLGRTIYRLTITGDVIHKAFKPYLNKLRAQGKDIKTVLTRISVMQGINNRPLFRFEEVL